MVPQDSQSSVSSFVQKSILISKAVKICQQSQTTYCYNIRAQIICYIRFKYIKEIFAESLNCHLYHITLKHQKQTLRAWCADEESPVMIATSALGAGLNQPLMHLVLHVDTSASMLNYAQESECAGHNDLPARSLIILTDDWTVSWQHCFHSYFFQENQKQMTEFLQSFWCYHQQLTFYLNEGPEIQCLRAGSRVNACEFC